jgi:cyclophilin family peptidyl-prolyl cis-trans isomerase
MVRNRCLTDSVPCHSATHHHCSCCWCCSLSLLFDFLNPVSSIRIFPFSFGYVVEGADFLSDIKEGDVIVSAKVTKGLEFLHQPGK